MATRPIITTDAGPSQISALSATIAARRDPLTDQTDQQIEYNVAQSELSQLAVYGHFKHWPSSTAHPREYIEVVRAAMERFERAVLEAGPADAEPAVARFCYLSPPDFHRLDWACRPVAAAFGCPVYLVGSVLSTAAYRDIDLRLILPDCAAAVIASASVRLLFNIALSDLIAKAAGLSAPIDFQIQSMTEANVPGHGARNPLGVDVGPARI